MPQSLRVRSEKSGRVTPAIRGELIKCLGASSRSGEDTSEFGRIRSATSQGKTQLRPECRFLQQTLAERNATQATPASGCQNAIRELAQRPSHAFGAVQPSYTPGVHLGDLGSALPAYAIAAIREALPAFDRQIRGFALHDALLTGVETRTSSPLRIKRNDADLQSLNTHGLYPAGEGAGYAGGILSAAIDGIRVAEALALQTGDR